MSTPDDGRAVDAVGPTTCGRCGNEATGFASICEVRFCHGDGDAEPTCYQLQQWEMSATGSFLLRLHVEGFGS